MRAPFASQFVTRDSMRAEVRQTSSSFAFCQHFGLESTQVSNGSFLELEFGVLAVDQTVVEPSKLYTLKCILLHRLKSNDHTKTEQICAIHVCYTHEAHIKQTCSKCVLHVCKHEANMKQACNTLSDQKISDVRAYSVLQSLYISVFRNPALNQITNQMYTLSCQNVSEQYILTMVNQRKSQPFFNTHNMCFST